MTETPDAPRPDGPSARARTGGRASFAHLLRLALPLVLVTGLVAPLVYSTWRTFEHQRSFLERASLFELEHMVGIVADGLREPIWNLTPELGQGVVESLMRDRRVLSVSVSSEAQGLSCRV